MSSLRSRSGQAIAEMAIIMPLLMLFVFGLVEVSGAWRTFNVVTNVSREGARLAVVPLATETQVTADMATRMNANGLVDSLATVTILCDGSAGMCITSGQESSVALSYPYRFRLFGPIVDWLCSGACTASFGTIPITSTTIMRKE
jgi:Flp pilus assembly protein TadG